MRRCVLHAIVRRSDFNVQGKLDKAAQLLQSHSNVHKLAQDDALSSPALPMKNFPITSIQLYKSLIPRNRVAAFSCTSRRSRPMELDPLSSLKPHGYTTHHVLANKPFILTDKQTNPTHLKLTYSRAPVKANALPASSRPHVLLPIFE